VDDQAEVRPDEPVAGRTTPPHRPAELGGVLALVEARLGVPPGFDGLGELDLLLSGEEGDHPDLVKVLSD
jgi:hypothetical protein